MCPLASAPTRQGFYRMLAVERGWSGERYEAWLGETLVETLQAKAKRKR